MRESFKNALGTDDLNLEDIKSYYENIIALMPGHVYWKDKNGAFLGCNEAQARSAGFARKEELIGKTDFEMPWKDQATLLQKIDKEVMQTGIPRTVEEPSQLADGTEALFLSKKVPLYHKGEVIGILGISFDITEQRQTERKLQETQAKLEGMTQVSASIAHELRTPLAAMNFAISNLKQDVLAFLEMVAVEGLPFAAFALLSEIQQRLQRMQREIEAASSVIDMLLLNLNPVSDKSRIKVFSLQACIEQALARYPLTPTQRQWVKWQRDSITDCWVKGEPELVIHVLFNLLKNAIHYVMKAGKGDIQIWIASDESGHQLFFKDTGSGIAAEHLPHIFEQFFSQTSHGAGVGLSFCRWVMNNLGGEITCQSSEGEYTLFMLNFPAAQE